MTGLEIEKDRGSTEAISHCLKRVTFELADLQGRRELSMVFGTERLWHLVLLDNLHSLLCRYYVLTVVFQPLLGKQVADCTNSQFQRKTSFRCDTLFSSEYSLYPFKLYDDRWQQRREVGGRSSNGMICGTSAHCTRSGTLRSAEKRVSLWIYSTQPMRVTSVVLEVLRKSDSAVPSKSLKTYIYLLNYIYNS